MAYVPADHLLAIEGTALEWTESHCEDGKGLLLNQFRKPRIEAMLCGLLEGVQDFDDGAWQVLTGRGIEWAIGQQLDDLGALLDYPRHGRSDETYRLVLRAQVLTLKSNGTWPELVAIMSLLGVTLSLTTITDQLDASARLVLAEVLSGDVDAAEIFGFLRRAKKAGVRIDLEFSTLEQSTLFMWADADVQQADTVQGWGNDALTQGGYWGDVLSTVNP